MGWGNSAAGSKQVGEWMESRVQLQAIYKCSGQLPSHNRQSAHQANINQLMLQAKVNNIRSYGAFLERKYVSHMSNLQTWE